MSIKNRFYKKSAPEDYSVPIGQWQAPITSDPNNPYSDYPAVQQFEQIVPAQGMPGEAAQTDISQYYVNDKINPPKSSLKYENSGGNNVQKPQEPTLKELFEADSLLHTMERLDIDPQDVIKKFVPSWLHSMSNLGKLILIIESNYETFIEQFGEEITTSLLQNLKNLFLKFGKTVLSLQQNFPKENTRGLFTSEDLERSVNV
jgi:hypothetical protein